MTVTLHEIETHWSLDDLLDAHLAIQVREQAERLFAQRRAAESEAARRSHRPLRR